MSTQTTQRTGSCHHPHRTNHSPCKCVTAIAGALASHRRRFARSRGIVDIQVVRIEVGRYRQRGGVDGLHTPAVYFEHQT